jgi:glycosyltransferase involved in cell wall biosynthesis
LWWIGRAGPALDELRAAVAASPLRASVRWDAERPEAEMPGVVARAGALVHLDERAGTPVTPLEALAVGTPVVASRAAVFEEALGDAAEYVDEAAALREPDALTAAIERALEGAADPAACARRELAARAFTWERSARAHVEAWERALACGPTGA